MPKIKQFKLALLNNCTPCPNPFSLKIDASRPNIYKPDFNFKKIAAELGISVNDIRTTMKIKETKSNLFYCHTFIWKPLHKCCQITKATLTVKMKALADGRGGMAGNDRILIIHLGDTVAPYNEPVYDFIPFYPGQTSTKIWNISGLALHYLNVEKRLSLLVQDDTSVLSAVLEIEGCCLDSKEIS